MRCGKVSTLINTHFLTRRVQLHSSLSGNKASLIETTHSLNARIKMGLFGVKFIKTQVMKISLNLIRPITKAIFVLLVVCVWIGQQAAYAEHVRNEKPI